MSEISASISMPYFLATPAAGPSTSAVVVVHEGNGISPQLLRFCQRLAGEGYTVIAPDLFFRFGGTEAVDPMKLISHLDFDQALRDLAEAADIVRGMGAEKVGVTGFCMGGSFSYRCALAGGYDAAAGFYGSNVAKDLGEPKFPTLLFFGGSDQWIPAADIAAVAAHHEATTVYPEAGHGFMRDGSPDFVEAAATDAWERLTTLFSTYL
jgi:carboxymethylenebutenolidase